MVNSLCSFPSGLWSAWKVCVVADVPLPSAVPSSELLNAVQPVNASTPAHAAAATAAATAAAERRHYAHNSMALPPSKAGRATR